LVLQNEINNLAYIIDQAGAKGMKIIFNPAPFSEEILKLPFESIDTLVVNETEGAGIAGTAQGIEATLETLSHRYPHINIILTAGSAGAYFSGNNDRFFVPAEKTRTVDSTAAGDTFVGYYTVACLKEVDHKGAVQKAVKAAALTVSRKGAMQSIPHYSEIKS
jgi:ribokinase